jgi:hypothetical protein
MVGVLWKVPREAFTNCVLGSSVTIARTVVGTSGYATEAGNENEQKLSNGLIDLSFIKR